ncbi:threonine/serine exporter ThrE [Corynebacterium lizhenjunii]|uniref:threonine/serine exporter ThrE n=1 Tax=Corynebacterium lizhenjunii TaxID=2709394 RepID=UPI00197F7164|nr:threonine/serine exporter family protein [Corynebacterium lizhenjunii]
MGSWKDKLSAVFAGSRHRIATIDTARAAPPPSPLAPVDLTDPAQVTGVMEIAARIGELLICAGTSNADARAQVYLAAASYGLHYCHVDIMMNTITIHTNVGTGADRRPLHVFRVAPGIDVNFSKLSAVDKLIRSIHSGSTPPALAERILDEIDRMPPPRSVGPTLVGWGVMGAGFSVMLGGGALTAVVTFLIALTVMGVNAYLARLRVPTFYQNIVGGMIAVLPAAALYNVAAHMGVTLIPSQIIGSGIIVLVAGLTLVQCLVDGITRAPVTSSARFFEAMMATGAIVGGVGIGIQLADALGVPLPPLETTAPPVYHQVPLLILTGSIGSAAFAYAVYATWKEVIISGLTAAAGMVFYYFVVIPFGVGTVIACGIAAIAVGLAGGLLARRYYIPPLITMIIGYTPMLPGVTLYRGMYATINEQIITGFSNLATALAIAGAVAAGVVLGERGARRLRRPQHFRPYSAFKRLGRFSFQQARNLAGRAPRIPRVPLSPFAPKLTRPVPPPVQGPQPDRNTPAATTPTGSFAGADVRSKQDEAYKEQLEAWDSTEVLEVLDQLDPVTDTWEALSLPLAEGSSSPDDPGVSPRQG